MKEDWSATKDEGDYEDDIDEQERKIESGNWKQPRKPHLWGFKH